MASSPPPSFEESFDALIKYLSKAIKAQKTISIPDEIEKPFRAVSHPADASLLRKLLKFFDGKQQHHVLQLAPKSFCGIVFIALHFPYSTTQDKLIYTFMNALRIYRDDSATILCRKKCGLHNIKKAQVQADRQAIAQRLLHPLLQRYVGAGLGKKLRWTVAQLLSLLIYNDEPTRGRLASLPEIKHFSTLLQDLDDYVGRFLVADLMRHLIHHGADPGIFWPQGTPDQLLSGFPAAEHSSVDWLVKLRRYFADLDTTLAFGAGRQCMLPVSELVCSRGAHDQADSDAILIPSDDLTCIMDSDEDVLRIRSFPVFQRSGMTASSDSITKEVRVTYLKDNGFELCNGSKSAVNGICFRFADTGDAQTAQDIITNGQQQAAHADNETAAEKTNTSAATPEPKRSIALVNLWSPERQPPSNAHPTLHVEQDRGLDIQDLSPLQHRSQPLSQTHTAHSGASKGPGGLDSENASETSFLEAGQDKQALPERLQASQSSSLNMHTTSDFNARVDDAVARHKPSKLDSRGATQEGRPRKEGTTTGSPHLPRDDGQQPLKSNPSKQNLLLNSDKHASTEHVQQTTKLIGTVAVSPTPPIPRPATSPKSKRSNMAKIASGPPPATSTLKKPTKTPGGPAARLAGSQQQSQKQASKSTSSTNDVLKRKSLTSQKELSSKTTDWDEDLRDDSQFDIPDDPSEEERPTKRARKGGKQPDRKPAAKSSRAPASKKAQPSKDAKRAAGGLKKAQAEELSEATKETVASTRERRTQKSTKYVEPSDSEVDEDEQSGAVLDIVSEQASSPTKGNGPQPSIAPPAPKKVGIARRLHSQSLNVPKPKSNRVEQEDLPLRKDPAGKDEKKAHPKTSSSHESPQETSERSPARTSASASDVRGTRQNGSVPGGQVLERPSALDRLDHDNVIDAEVAHDSHPMDRAGTEAAAAAARDSFGTQLQTQLADIAVANHDDQQDKENVPPAPQTPFGNKKAFVANVNAAKSTSAKKGPVSQVPRSPESHTPRTTRASATKPEEARAARPLLDHSAQVSAAMRGGEPLHEQSMHTSGETQDEVVIPGAPAHDDSIVIADDEMPDAPIPVLEQTASTQERRATVYATELPNASRELGAALAEPPDVAGKFTGDHSNNLSPPEIADEGRTAKPTRHREPPGGGTLGNDNLYTSPKKRAAAEIAKSSEGQGGRASVMGTGLKAMVSASMPGNSPLVADLRKPAARDSSITQADTTMITKRPKPAARKSTAFEAREVKTPRRKIEEPIGTLTSERTTKKPLLVHFETHGPANQGANSGTGTRRSSGVSLPPTETGKHHNAMQQGMEANSIDTPSHQPAPGVNTGTTTLKSDKSHDADEDGIAVEDEVELDPPRLAANLDHVSDAGQEEPRSESPASVGQPGMARTVNIEADSEPDSVNDAGPNETSLDTSIQPASSSESDEDEVSEYEEGSEPVDDSCEMEASHTENPAEDHEFLAAPRVTSSHIVSEALTTSTDKVDKASEPTTRGSFGLGEIVKQTNPGARDKITTTELRPTQQQADRARHVNASTASGPGIRKPTIDAIKRADVADGFLMPPPKSGPRQSIGKDKRRDLTRSVPGGQGLPDHSQHSDRTANPLAELTATSVSRAGESRSAKRDDDRSGERTAIAPIRVKRQSLPGPSPEPVLPMGTPMTFLAKLAETTTHVDEAHDRRKKTGSYLSEDIADATLVNSNSLSTMFHRPARRESRYQRGMTEITDESPPPSSVGDGHAGWNDKMVWEQAIRPPHRSLFENVMQIANGVLFRLGEEEDAIRAKISEYHGGGNIVLDEAAKSWGRRMLHENGKVVQNLAVGRDALVMKLERLGKDAKGAPQEWEKIQRVGNITKMVMAREQEVLAGLETLSGGFHARESGSPA